MSEESKDLELSGHLLSTWDVARLLYPGRSESHMVLMRPRTIGATWGDFPSWCSTKTIPRRSLPPMWENLVSDDPRPQPSRLGEPRVAHDCWGSWRNRAKGWPRG